MLSAAVLDRISSEVGVSKEQVARTISLLDSGNTIPFIARYRKDATGGLDESRLEAIEDRNHYFTALEQRRRAILQNVEKLGKLTEPLRAAIEACMEKAALEDLYLPYKRKRQTRATIARARGLAALAEFIRSGPGDDLAAEAAKHVDPAKGVVTADDAIAGARDVLAEDISEDASIRAFLRDRMMTAGLLRAHATKMAEDGKTKYESFYNFSEPLAKVPAHRLLAILRGNREGVLRIEVQLDDAALKTELVQRNNADAPTARGAAMRDAISDAYDRLLRPSIESEAINEARQRADESAIRVFRENVKSLLLAPPVGRIVVMGVDPGLKSGSKLVVVSDTGDVVGFAVVHPEASGKRENAHAVVRDLIRRLKVGAIAIGNGTGSREAMTFIRECLDGIAENKPFVALVSESGASVYSASKIARDEFPDMDVTLRGAVSIARRLQDPLAELVKIEPRSVGVGQYQHDVNQKRLREGLHQTVTVCVNQVGAELNTASVSLLRYVAGIQYGTAQNIVEIRRQKGGFKSREELQQVPGIGPKIFQQCAGFLRIRDAQHPLDATGIHPEAYEVVAKMAGSVGATLKDLIGNTELTAKITADSFVSETIGKAAIEDILKELSRPGRDPRRKFAPVEFDNAVRSVQDVEEGMVLPGMVTNVTDFGAFVDIGVGQDGLVHLSELTHRFVRDPRQIVRVGDSVNVKVIALDKAAPRISFSMKAIEPKRPPRRRPKQRPEPARAGEAKPADAAAVEVRPRREGRRDRASAAHANGPREQDGRAKRDEQRGHGQRRDQASHRDVAGEGGRRPERKPRRDQSQRDRPRSDRPRREKASRGDGAISRPVQTTTTDTPLNTQLADQLAALRDKLKAG